MSNFDSLRQLLQHIQAHPKEYGNGRFQRFLSQCVASMANDDDCIVRQHRIQFGKKKYLTHGLLFSLCYEPADERTRHLRLAHIERTCKTVGCINPRHHRTKVFTTKRKHAQTQLDAAALRSHFPMTKKDLLGNRVCVVTKRAKLQ